jgi:N-acetylglucosaminyldiphosphoundecaprenol N-acetyl-beta-D-mannosaminyltransferase
MVQAGERRDASVMSRDGRDPTTDRSFRVLDVDVDAIDMDEAVEFIDSALRERRKIFVIFCTVSTLLEARHDPALKEALAAADLVTPDGMPLVWVGRRRGRKVGRVYGPDLLVEFATRTGSRWSHYFYGAAPGVPELVGERLEERVPGFRVAGAYSPPYGPRSDAPRDEDLDRIDAAEADVVWVGLGHPKQERWMHASRERVNAPVLAGVGAAFDFVAGLKKESPRWMMKLGLQWLHRLIVEPRRLWRRYLIGNAIFLALLLREELRRLRSR